MAPDSNTLAAAGPASTLDALAYPLARARVRVTHARETGQRGDNRLLARGVLAATGDGRGHATDDDRSIAVRGRLRGPGRGWGHHRS